MTSNRNSQLLQIISSAKMARAGSFGVLSTGEQLAAALVLNRADLLEQAGFTMAQAIERLEGAWLASIPEAERALRDEGVL